MNIMNTTINQMRTVSLLNRRSYKNFGHKREPIPGVTTLWHGFLTFTFLGMCLKWEKIGTWIFGERKKPELDWDDESS